MSDASVRALRTVAQNLLFDVLLAVVVVVLPAVQGDATNWSLVGAAAVKTAAVTALSWLHKFLNDRRPTPQP